MIHGTNLWPLMVSYFISVLLSHLLSRLRLGRALKRSNNCNTFFLSPVLPLPPPEVKIIAFHSREAPDMLADVNEREAIINN